MGYHEHRHLSPKNVGCAVVTISDSRSEADDESGQLIQGRLRDHGHTVADYRLLKNDAAAIRAAITELVGRDDVQAIITNGGTTMTLELSPSGKQTVDKEGRIRIHGTNALKAKSSDVSVIANSGGCIISLS